MKSLKILIAGLLLASQSYAFSKSDRNLLLGITAGTVIGYVLLSHDINSNKVSNSKIVYVDNHNKHYKKSKKSKRYNNKRSSRHTHYYSHHNEYKKVHFKHNKYERKRYSEYASSNSKYRGHRYRY